MANLAFRRTSASAAGEGSFRYFRGVPWNWQAGLSPNRNRQAAIKSTPSPSAHAGPGLRGSPRTTLHQVAPCLVTSNARGSGVPAISRMAACPTQSSEPGTEPVTDTDVDECGVTFATESVDPPFPRDEPMLRRGIQAMPRRPQGSPVLALRMAVVVHFRHVRSFPVAQIQWRGVASGRPGSGHLCRRSNDGTSRTEARRSSRYVTAAGHQFRRASHIMQGRCVASTIPVSTMPG